MDLFDLSSPRFVEVTDSTTPNYAEQTDIAAGREADTGATTLKVHSFAAEPIDGALKNGWTLESTLRNLEWLTKRSSVLGLQSTG